MRMNGSRMVCESLVAEGVRVVFGLPGGAIMPLYDVLPQYPFKHVLVRHEQGAAHMADGYGRASGDVGVCLATSGPGAINLVVGLATAMMDSPGCRHHGKRGQHRDRLGRLPGSGYHGHLDSRHEAQLPSAGYQRPASCD